MTSNEDVIEYTNSKLVERWKAHALISEVDFLVGVMAAMTAVEHGKDTKILWTGTPPHWIFYAMGNRSIVAELLREQGEEGLANRAEIQETEFNYRVRKLDTLVDFVKQSVRILQPYGSENLKALRETAIFLLEEMNEEEE